LWNEQTVQRKKRSAVLMQNFIFHIMEQILVAPCAVQPAISVPAAVGCITLCAGRALLARTGGVQ
jgi:hypothetical protein